MTDDKIIEVVQAHMQGKKIEYREVYLRENGRWIPADTSDLWDFRNRRYRVAPEPRKPREFVLMPNCSNDGWYVLPPNSLAYPINCIRVREVIE